MFKDVGKKIKGYATFLYIMTILLTVVIGAAIAFDVLNLFGGEYLLVRIAICVAVILFGIIFGYLSNMLLAGFGEVIHSTYEILEILKKKA